MSGNEHRHMRRPISRHSPQRLQQGDGDDAGSEKAEK